MGSKIGKISEDLKFHREECLGNVPFAGLHGAKLLIFCILGFDLPAKPRRPLWRARLTQSLLTRAMGQASIPPAFRPDAGPVSPSPLEECGEDVL